MLFNILFSQKQTPPVKDFAEFFENELYDAFDSAVAGKGDTGYQNIRFLYNDFLEQLMSTTTVWLTDTTNEDIVASGDTVNQLSPNSLKNSERNKRLREEIAYEGSTTVFGAISESSLESPVDDRMQSRARVEQSSSSGSGNIDIIVPLIVTNTSFAFQTELIFNYFNVRTSAANFTAKKWSPVS